MSSLFIISENPPVSEATTGLEKFMADIKTRFDLYVCEVE